MIAQKQNKRKIIRNLVLFVIILNLLAWSGWFVAQDGTEESIGLGTLVWLGAPLLASFIIRLFSKDWKDLGLRPRFNGNGKWYVFSLLAFPIIVACVLLIGAAFGGVSLVNFQVKPFFAALAAAFFSFTLVKNLLEEFAWRGYLTPKVNSVVKNPIAGHLIVGLIWGTWHIPYYLTLLERASLAAYTSQDMMIFLPMVILGMALAGILFGEIRLMTGSTWPAFLMHMVSNVVIMTLLIDGYVEVQTKTEFLFSPSWEGVLTMLLVTVAGLWLYKKRKAKI